LLLLVFFLFVNTPQKAVKLDTEGRGLFNVLQDSLGTYNDGSVLIVTRYTMYHFAENGKLIQRIGRRGQGPGEFGYIGAAVWTGEYYVISDAGPLNTSIFDENGKFIIRSKKYYNSLYRFDDKIFFRRGEPIKQFQGERPEMLGQLEIKNQKIVESPYRFHILSQRNVDLFYNYTHHYISKHEDTLYIHDMLSPLVTSYKVDNPTPIGEYPLRLPGFVNAPDKFPDHFIGGPGRQKYFKWKAQWSTILGFGYMDNLFVIAYELPEDQREYEKHLRVATCDLSGKPLEVIDLSGYFVGVRNGAFITLEIKDEEDGGSNFYLNHYNLK
jgi:hypothetical protein